MSKERRIQAFLKTLALNEMQKKKNKNKKDNDSCKNLQQI